ncbi:MAG: glycosyltransferase [Chloroflexi bacterium]|nr:glycosyltransferase [Chloroflexota bacterium]
MLLHQQHGANRAMTLDVASPIRPDLLDAPGLPAIKPDAIDLSLVIPVYNEVESLPELYEKLTAVLIAQHCAYEIVFIDDGSTDGTFEGIRDLHLRDPQRVRVLSFRRNFGKTAALVAGFDYCRGEVIITMDADLQDDPEEIPNFLDKLAEGYDLVSGWKKDRQDPWTKTLPSRLFNKVVSSSTGIDIHDFNNGFKAYRREVTEELKLYADLHRFIPVMASWRGFRVAEIPVRHHPRKHGKSKFGAGRFARGMLDFFKVMFLTRYMQKPLHLFGAIGVALAFLGILVDVYLTEEHFRVGNIGSRPLLDFSLLLVITGVQLFSLGLLGEMLRHVSYRRAEEYSIRQRLE